MVHKVCKDALMVSLCPANLQRRLSLTLSVLAEELELGMRLLGVTSLDQLGPNMVNAQRLLNEMWRPDSVAAFKSRL